LAEKASATASMLFSSSRKRLKKRRADEKMRWRVCTKYGSSGGERSPKGKRGGRKEERRE
jgi:hypothetical protein